MKTFAAQVLFDHNNTPLIVFGKGRTKYYAVEATAGVVRLTALNTVHDLRPVEYRGKAYSPRKAASFYLNHSVRNITTRARAVLRSLVARQPKAAA